MGDIVPGELDFGGEHDGEGEFVELEGVDFDVSVVAGEETGEHVEELPDIGHDEGAMFFEEEGEFVEEFEVGYFDEGVNKNFNIH